MQKINKNDNKDSFNEIIKSKLENYSLPVDDNSWNEIETRLAMQSEAKRVALLPWIAGVAAAACIALICIFFPFSEQPLPNEVVEQLPVSGQIAPAQVAILSPNPTKPLLSRKQKQVNSTTISESVAGTELIAITETVEPTEAVTIHESEVNQGKNSGEKSGDAVPEQKKVPDKKDIYEKFYAYKEEPLLPTDHRSAKKSNTLGFHLGSGGGLLAMNDADNSAMSELRGMSIGTDKIASNAPVYMAKALFSVDDFSNITHYAPVSLGLSFKKDLNNTFALESGLIYTFLSSKFENTNPKRDANLQLHYLGIPLHLHTKLYTSPNEKWKFYLSTGTTLEKGLLAHYSQREYDSNTVIHANSNEKINGLQWSLNASIGIDYKLNKHYSIYFEPQVGYYLKNNQPVSARTENPLIISLNMGFRYSW
jgi:hypothetical protein